MKVSNLIEQLSKQDPKANVFVQAYSPGEENLYSECNEITSWSKITTDVVIIKSSRGTPVVSGKLLETWKPR